MANAVWHRPALCLKRPVNQTDRGNTYVLQSFIQQYNLSSYRGPLTAIHIPTMYSIYFSAVLGVTSCLALFHVHSPSHDYMYHWSNFRHKIKAFCISNIGIFTSFGVFIEYLSKALYTPSAVYFLLLFFFKIFRTKVVPKHARKKINGYAECFNIIEYRQHNRSRSKKPPKDFGPMLEKRNNQWQKSSNF